LSTPRGIISISESSIAEIVNSDVEMKRPALALVMKNGKKKYFIASNPHEVSK